MSSRPNESLAVSIGGTAASESPMSVARIDWSIARTDIARIDSVTLDSKRVYVRAISPGSAALTLTGGGVTGSVPVQVK